MRSGEITYTCLGGYTYSITVTTYTKTSSCAADRCVDTVYFGDGTYAVAPRTNGPPCSTPGIETQYGCPTSMGGTGPLPNNPYCGFCGVQIVPWSLVMKLNYYSCVHTYPGPGTYIISMTDAARNDNIVNVGTGVSFSIQDTLNVGAFYGCVNSPIFTHPPIDAACLGQCFVTNPGAISPNGDSLAYHLGTCFDYPSHLIPNNLTVGVTDLPTINPITGDFRWCSPTVQSGYSLPYQYNYAIDIQDWKKVYGQYVLVGTVRRDMQVLVYDCHHNPPIVTPVNDTCILANTVFTITDTAINPNGFNIQSFIATGDPFNVNPSATFSTSPTLPPVNNSTIVVGTFSWTPTCLQVRNTPYNIQLTAVDDGRPDSPVPVYLSDYKTFNITVIAPAPKNLTVVPKCSEMKLNWDTVFCNNHTGNFLNKYEIYRKIGCDTLKHNYCETGVPASWGYTLIATVPYNVTTYTDNNGGVGLTPGGNYSYRVVALYHDGAESYCSDPVCQHLVRDVPIITNVDVISTSATSGQINVKWVKPLADPADFDSTATGVHGPYSFIVLRAIGFTNSNFQTIKTFTSPWFSTLDSTSYLDNGLNTSSHPYTYRVDFYYPSSTDSCPTQNASSVFLSCQTGQSRKMQLSWQTNVPWTNDSFTVFRKNISNGWDSIGKTNLQTFTDSNLSNGKSYCYKIKSIGHYGDTALPHPLINWSEELCCTPEDRTPPCANLLAVDSSCELSQNLLKWTNPNSIFCSSCPNCIDALYYIIYFSPTQGGDLSAIDTIRNIQTTQFLYDGLKSIAGCYAVASVDSVGNQSAYSNIVCVDNCPSYQLPNVFTPNGDGANDWFTPIHPYKYVKDIDIKIYDRWGILVFHTTNPEIMWDGKSSQTNMMCADGVYYYICVVNDIRLKGIVPNVLKGNVSILSHK